MATRKKTIIVLNDEYRVEMDSLNKHLVKKSVSIRKSDNMKYISWEHVAYYSKWSLIFKRLIKEMTLDKCYDIDEVIPFEEWYRLLAMSEKEVQPIIERIDSMSE